MSRSALAPREVVVPPLRNQTTLFERSDGVKGWAELSPDGRDRYFLQRSWGTPPKYAPPGSVMVLWIGLNPSTADAATDDATIRRIVGFSRRWGMHHACVCNLFTLRATRPEEMWRAQPPPADPRNLEIIAGVAASAALVVACWGAPPPRREDVARHASAARAVADVCASIDQELWCLGLTASGHPRHPVRLPYAARLERFELR